MAAILNSIFLKVFSIFMALHVVKAAFEMEDDNLMTTYVDVFTPMDNKNNLNLSAIRPYADYLQKCGIKGVLVTGTTGETGHLTMKEKKQVIDTWIEECDRYDMGIIVEVCFQSLPNTFEMARYAEDRQVDCIAVTFNPYLPPGSVWELVENIRLIAERASKTPVIYFDNPRYNPRLNMTMLFEEATRKIPNFVGLACSLNTALQIMAQIEIKKYQRFMIYSDLEMAAVYDMGINGTISRSSNLAPSLACDIEKSAKRGDMNQAREKQLKLNQILVDSTFDGDYFSVSSLKSLKAGTSIRSCVEMGPVRPPLLRLSKAKQKSIADRLRDD